MQVLLNTEFYFPQFYYFYALYFILFFILYVISLLFLHECEFFSFCTKIEMYDFILIAFLGQDVQVCKIKIIIKKINKRKEIKIKNKTMC